MKRIVLPALILLIAGGQIAFGQLGVFSNEQDVGAVARAGAAKYDAEKREYLITGGGENMWMTNDEFHFVWTKVSGDFNLAADIQFPAPGGNAHRKACLMARQSLDADSAYVDIAEHGNGLTSLQFRDARGDTTHEIQLNVSAPGRVRIEKRGDIVSASFAATNGPLQVSGASCQLPFKAPFYVGLAVCAHDNKTTEQGRFSNVELETNAPGRSLAAIESTLETVSIASGDRSIIYHTAEHIEAPNWSRDGKYFLFNSGGRIYKLPVTGGTPEALDTGSETNCNNNHGVSPDGTQLAISDGSQGDRKSRVYVLPIDGGQPRQITRAGPSYWHGWSPDGKTLAYCAQRNGEFDVYTIPVKSGKEKRLTTAPGQDDGPDYSPDGKYIYFNSERSGRMQIWRMKPDGPEQEQVTSDDYDNWFPHPSPNGQWVVFLSYYQLVNPGNQDVMLRLMSLSDRKIRVLAKLYGTQGTMNVPSWSPDSKSVAFVSYQMVYR